MSIVQERSATPAANSNHRRGSRSFAEAVLRWMLRGLQCGQLIVETPSGERLAFGGGYPGIQARLTVHRWRFLWRLIMGSDVGFAEAYIAGDWSSPDLNAVLKLACDNEASMASHAALHFPRVLLKVRHWMNRNTRRGSRRNISAHYDLGNEFYSKWLDSGMSYSAALFSSAQETLENAQDAKLDRVIDLMEISGGERVLEIGCGWGGLAERILERTNCTLTGLTLSSEQLEFARQRLAGRGLLSRCDLRLEDYRDVEGTFDRIVSVEMLEAVGERFWPAYFATLRSRLRPSGTAVLQVITINNARFDLYRSNPDFIQKHIFPGGMLPTKQIIERQAAQAGLQLVSTEFFGESYARTLEEWQRRFQKYWPQIKQIGFDERFKRTWNYYLSYCQAGFETGALDVGFIASRDNFSIAQRKYPATADSPCVFLSGHRSYPEI